VLRGEVAAVAPGKQTRGRSRSSGRASGAALPLRETGVGQLDLARLAPSGRSIVTGLLLLALAGGAYAVARGTSAFAVDAIAVEGPPRHVAAQVTTVLSDARGESLLGLDLPALQARVERVPSVAAARFDRAFPHTLRVIVVPERPVAVLRQGAASWLVAASGRVIKPLERGQRPGLPRLWLRPDVEVQVGNKVAGDVREAVRTVAPLVRAPLPKRVATVRYLDDELTLVLRSGAEIRLGDGTDRALKLELARRIVPRLTAEELYLDVSVPSRPVAGNNLNSQVEVEPSVSTTP
jgi:cell division protein FtsQ